MTRSLRALVKLSSVSLLSILSSACENTPFELNPTSTQSEAESEQLATGSRTETGSSDEIIIAAEARYRTQAYAASKSPNDASLQVRYLDTGMAVADLYCDAFLDQLVKQQTQFNAARDYTNLAGGAAATALGFAGGPASAIAMVALGSALVDSTLSTTANNFLVAPDIPQVQRLVAEAKEKLRTRMLKPGPSTFAEAYRNLLTYDQQCGFLGIKLLVNDAVSAGKVKFKEENSNTNLNAALATIEKQNLARYLGHSSLTDAEIAALYAYYVSGDGRSGEVEAKINSMFSKADLTKQANAAEIRVSLDKLANISDLAAKSADFVASTKKAVATETATTTVQKSIDAADQSVTDDAAKQAIEAANSATTAAAAQISPETVVSSGTIAATAVSNAEANVELAKGLDAAATGDTDLSGLIANVTKQINEAKKAAASSTESARAAIKITEAEGLLAEANSLAATSPDDARQKMAQAAGAIAEAISISAAAPRPDPNNSISPASDGTNSLILKVE
jgi:hypothetical protein